MSNPTAPPLAGSVAPGSKADLPPLTDDLVERYAAILMATPDVVADIERRRGWTSDTIQRVGLGWDGTYVWIPIRDSSGHLVNARMYDPFKRHMVKSFHYANPDGLRRTSVWVPFGIDSLTRHSTVWFFEGEPDAILAAQMGFPAAVITGGAGTWHQDATSILDGRQPVLCYDTDSAGRKGAASIVNRFASAGHEAIDVRMTFIDPGNKDFTDAVQRENRDRSWFKSLYAAVVDGAAPPSGPPPMVVKLGDGAPGEPITVKSHVLGSHTVPVLVPSAVEAHCRVDWGDPCNSCPVRPVNGRLMIDVDPESRDLLSLGVTPQKGQSVEFRRITGVPMRCPRVRFEVPSYWQAQHLRLVPPMADRQGGDSTIRAAVHVTPADGRPPSIRANQLYVFHGKVEPDPLSNEWTLVSADASPAEDDVDSFVVDQKAVADLSSAFNPDDWTADSIIDSIMAETRRLSRHVTRVYGRHELLIAVDLCYHSVLRFPFRGRTPTRGWLSLGILGDTRTAKSETMTTFSAYLGLGRYVMDPANTTYAGLVGGLQQVGRGDKSWTITWGLIPTNDRGLVVIDEISSLSTDDIGRMSGMRSSGVAELTKIRSASTPARTRLIMAGNPRGLSRTLASYGTPVEGFMELIGAPEDVARFDMAMALKQGLDKDAEDAKLGSQAQPIGMETRRDLVRFAWSRSSDQVEWEAGSERLVVDLASRQINDFDHGIPLVEPSEQDIKLARIAVAFACRTFSVTEADANVILVRRGHVEAADRFLRSLYGGDLGYAAYSDFRKRHRLDEAGATDIIVKNSGPSGAGATARALMGIRRVNPGSIGMALAMESADARLMISALAQVGAARFDGDASSYMVWTPGFMNLLRSIDRSPPEIQELAPSDMF